MIKKIFSFLVFLMLAPVGFDLNAQDDIPEPIGSCEKMAIVESIAEGYTPWKEISMSGKLSSSLLPISPSVKIYMEKGKLVVISVSAPLIGEAARIEIDNQQALVVNEISNTYITLSGDQIESVCPGGLEVLQNLILGRITILGSGELTKKDADKLEIYEVLQGDLLVLPNQDLENASYVYMYYVNPETLTLDRFVVMAEEGIGNVDVSYVWGNKDMIMNFESEISYGRPLQAVLKLNNPDTSVKRISRIELGSKYRKVGFRDILKM